MCMRTLLHTCTMFVHTVYHHPLYKAVDTHRSNQWRRLLNWLE